MHVHPDNLRSGSTVAAAGQAPGHARAVASTHLVSLRECSLVLDGRLCLNRVDLQVAPSECVAVLGPAKSGKSLLLECIEGLHMPCSGRAEVWGISAHRLQRIQREEIGTLRTRSALPPLLRVGQLLDFASNAAAQGGDQGDGAQALRLRLGLDAFSQFRVEQLDDANIAALSAWMALCRPRRLLLLDEPDAGLDSVRQQVLWDAVHAQQRAHGCAVVVTSRHGALARRCDRVLHLYKGRILPGQVVQACKTRALDTRRTAWAQRAAHPSPRPQPGPASTPDAAPAPSESRLDRIDRERALP